MALSSLKPLNRNHIPYLTFCKYPSTFNFNFFSHFNPKFSSFIDVRTRVTPSETTPFRTDKFQTIRSSEKRGKPVEEKIENRVSKLKQNSSRDRFFSERGRKVDSGFSSMRANAKDETLKEKLIIEGIEVVKDSEIKRFGGKGKSDEIEVKKNSRKRAKKNKSELPEVKLRVGLDMCSKKGDVVSAIKLYDFAQREGFQLGKYHYSIILYLCSSAAAGVVQAAKSGSVSRSLSTADPIEEGSKELGQFGKMSKMSFAANDSNPQAKTLDEMIQLITANVSNEGEDNRIQISDEMRKYSLERGLEIYQKIQSEKIEMNESTLTAVARMAMSLDNGDMAFDIVKQMMVLGISPKLRSYGPALSVFCNNGDIEKAFQIEQHMIENGVIPEEPELEALLRVSIDACKGDKVYYILHKLRTSVRKVSNSTVDLIEKWFNATSASRLGKRKWDEKLVKKSMANNGGGWHGLGWLGSGKWNLTRTLINGDGLCKCCGEKLATIDLDPIETENFAESVASLARTRERDTDFERFQKWLERYGPFGAVVDAANVGLYNQRKFRPSKVNSIVNGIRQKIPSKNWPLIVLHNRRITGVKTNEQNDKAIIETWRKSNALYATPTGSNDDWYWLYAAIKFKCLLITNDEMRDHLFQLLGNDFFPKWKERHQVRFSYSDAGPVFHMPPPYSVVIQESEKGHWHIPIQTEDEDSTEDSRIWLCITRPKQDTTSEREVTVLKQERHDNTKDLPGSSKNQRNVSPSSAKNDGRQNSLAQIMGAKKPR